MVQRFSMIAAASLFVPGVASAHPGHGTEVGLSHYLTDPYHLAVGMVIIAVAAIFVALVRRNLHCFPLWVRRRR